MADALSPDQLAAIKARIEKIHRHYAGRAVVPPLLFAALDLLAHIDSQAAELAAMKESKESDATASHWMKIRRMVREFNREPEEAASDSIPVPASVLAAVGVKLQRALEGIDRGSWMEDEVEEALGSIRYYLPASNSPQVKP